MFAEPFDRLDNVALLDLEHGNDRIVVQVGVGPVNHEHVRETRHRHAQVGFGALCPAIVQGLAAGSGHL
ncbi:hypothetical protein D3C71_1703010 [compost metagenome]